MLCELSLRFVIARLLAPLMLLFFQTKIAYADFDLEPGDKVRISLTGLEKLSFDAELDVHGDLDLKWLGQFKAGGLSLDQLEQMVRLEAAGKIVKQYDIDGEIFIIQLDGDEIEVVRNGYRPIVIGGDVARTGQIDYHPTLTVREAIALAGGLRSKLLADDVTIDPIQLLRWQTAYGQAALEHAQFLVQEWRVNSELEINNELAPPTAAEVHISPKVLDELISEQTKIRTINIENETGQRKYFEDAEEQAAQRLDILGQQKTELAKALSADEIEEARVVNLVERGLAPGSRLADTRRTTVMSATRLLDVEEDLTTTGLLLTRLIRDREFYEQERLLRLLQERRVASLSVRDASVQLDTIAKYLAGVSNEIGTENLISDIEFSSKIYRMTDGQPKTINADELTSLLPGDSLEISVQEITQPQPLTD